eukprot:g20228.t1
MLTDDAVLAMKKSLEPPNGKLLRKLREGVVIKQVETERPPQHAAVVRVRAVTGQDGGADVYPPVRPVERSAESERAQDGQ